MNAARRLAAILAADVVGYSRMMGADEAGTAKVVRERREAATPIVRAFGGRLVKTTGDGVLLEFLSVVAAVECAIAIQKMMAERNAALPEAKRILYRVGVNLGDILIEGDDILGDGVNVAARLEGICEPGAICLSEDAYRQTHGRIEAEFVDLGERELKNIAKPVRVYGVTQLAIAAAKAEVPAIPPAQQGAATPAATLKARLLQRWPALATALALALLAAGAFAWRAGYAPRFMAASVDDKLANAPRLSIVVLPFENLSGDKERDYFADAITDDLTTDLSHLDGSFVIARGTAYSYKAKPIDVKQIGRELGVRYLLEGSVRQVGETITINAQLVSTETGAHIWADRFDGERSKLGELQVEFVSRLANSLGVELVRAEALRAMRERPNNPDAADLVMRGWTVLNSNPADKAALGDAAALFERALALDAQNVPAMIGLAQALASRAGMYWSDDRPGDIARAEETIDRALTLQPHNSFAHATKGYVYDAKKQWGPAIAEAEAAIAEDPNSADSYAQASFRKIYMGRSEDAFAGIEKALRLSPRDPSVPWWQYYICHLHTHLAQWEHAIEWCSKSAAGIPQAWYPYLDLAADNAWAGHMKEARDAAAQLQKAYPGFTVQTLLGMHWTDDPTFDAQYQRLAEGLRKAGVPEGEKKTD